jgi:hypothetical protein
VQPNLTIWKVGIPIDLKMDKLLALESAIIDYLAWPTWAVRLNALLMPLLFLVWLISTIVTYETPKSATIQATWAFRYFQLQYLTVYLITMLADWLQGTHMYTLYQVSHLPSCNPSCLLNVCFFSLMASKLEHYF